MACIPVLSYILLGHRRGLWLTSGSLTAAIISYWVGADRLPQLLEPMRLINTVTATLGLFVVCHFWTVGQATARERLLRLSETNPLTGLDNRAAFDRAFERERTRHERTGTPVSPV